MKKGKLVAWNKIYPSKFDTPDKTSFRAADKTCLSKHRLLTDKEKTERKEARKAAKKARRGK